jgi:hypothetical protein
MILDECVRDLSYLSYQIKQTGLMTLDDVMPEVSLGESDLSGWSEIILLCLRGLGWGIFMSHE